ncbi:hypothetical protein [Paragemmobacter straminiformis]|nr:hypothetical protein [Gemmobacter straminiformis]
MTQAATPSRFGTERTQAATLPALPWGEGFLALTVLFLILAAL